MDDWLSTKHGILPIPIHTQRHMGHEIPQKHRDLDLVRNCVTVNTSHRPFTVAFAFHHIMLLSYTSRSVFVKIAGA